MEGVRQRPNVPRPKPVRPLNHPQRKLQNPGSKARNFPEPDSDDVGDRAERYETEKPPRHKEPRSVHQAAPQPGSRVRASWDLFLVAFGEELCQAMRWKREQHDHHDDKKQHDQQKEQSQAGILG